MTKGKKLGILAGIAVILGAGVLLSSILPPKEGAPSGEQVYDVCRINAASVVELTWDTGDGALTVSREKGSEVWSLAGDAEFPVDPAVVKEMLAAVGQVSAFRRLDRVENREQYGLAPANMTITVRGTETVTFLVGNENGGAGGFYLQLAGEDSTVYLSQNAMSECFQVGLEELAKVEELPDLSTVQSFQVAGSNSFSLQKDSSGTKSYGTFQWFGKVSGKWVPVDQYDALDVIQAVIYLQWSGCAKYDATGVDLSVYGLDAPQMTVTVGYREAVTKETGEVDEDGQTVTKTEYEDRTLRLWIGAEREGVYYVKAEGLRGIYLLDRETVSLLQATQVEAMRPRTVCPIDRDTVEILEVTVDGKTSALSFHRETVKDDGGKEMTVTTYRLDGKEADAAKAEGVLDALEGLYAEHTVNDGRPVQAGEISLRFFRNTKVFSQVEMHFVPYDSSFYLLSAEGEARLLVSKTDLSDWLRAWEGLSEK